MEKDYPADSTIRDYLLGKLDDQPETESKLGEQMLFDDELSEIVDAMEDEIIEDYLDGALAAEDRQAAEEYFLRPPERKEKLEFARCLRRRLQERSAVPDAPAILPDVEHKHGQVLRWPFYVRILAGLAAVAVLLVATCTYLARVRHRFQSELAASHGAQVQLQKQLEQERLQSASLAKELEKFEPRVVSVTFFGIYRDNSKNPPVEIHPFTERIHVEVSLPNAAARTNAYDVKLQNKVGEEIWAQPGVQVSAGGLTFDLPAQAIPRTGQYCVVIASQPQPYCFQAKVTR